MTVPLLCAAGVLLIAAGALAPTPGAVGASKGEILYQQCNSCHSLEAGDNLPSGPTLHRIVDKPIAAEDGFHYSPALRRFAQQYPRWTPELLDRLIADPEALVPGTYMSFHGIADLAERAALIAYLKNGAGAAASH